MGKRTRDEGWEREREKGSFMTSFPISWWRVSRPRKLDKRAGKPYAECAQFPSSCWIPRFLKNHPASYFKIWCILLTLALFFPTKFHVAGGRFSETWFFSLEEGRFLVHSYLQEKKDDIYAKLDREKERYQLPSLVLRTSRIYALSFWSAFAIRRDVKDADFIFGDFRITCNYFGFYFRRF